MVTYTMVLGEILSPLFLDPIPSCLTPYSDTWYPQPAHISPFPVRQMIITFTLR